MADEAGGGNADARDAVAPSEQLDAAQLSALLGAVVAIGADLDLRAVLTRVVETAAQLVGARYGALGVADTSGRHLDDFVTVGVDSATRSAIGPPPQGEGLLGRLLIDPQPLRVADIGREPDSVGFPPHHPVMTTFLGVPIFIRGEVFGSLYLADKIDDLDSSDEAPGFTDVDVEFVQALAAAAAVAIDNARLHERARDLDLVVDRERIARDLHDTVIQRLFATGLSLQAVTRLVDRPEALERIERSIDDLDETVRQIRVAIFGLQEPPTARSGSLRSGLRSLVQEWSDILGFAPTLRIDGPVDTEVGPTVAAHALAVVREGLANVYRHAHAAEALVRAEVSAGHLVVGVEDAGIGPSAPIAHGGGLTDVVDRAEQLGGSATFAAKSGGGSVLMWRVPLTATRSA